MTDYSEAACLGQDPELWFLAHASNDRNHALRTCNGGPPTATRPAQDPCPLREQCLRDALAAEAVADTLHLYGIYGGLTPKERAGLVVPLCLRCREVPRLRGGGTWRYCAPCRVVVKNEWKATAETNRRVAA